MYGVVLWSDKTQNRAVIWCEDHRNLAFFRQEPDAEEGGGFVPGDLVEFDLREENNLRLAVDPCVVAPHEFPSLATDLKSACEGMRRTKILPPQPDERGGGVVMLHPHHPAAAVGRTVSRSYG